MQGKVRASSDTTDKWYLVNVLLDYLPRPHPTCDICGEVYNYVMMTGSGQRRLCTDCWEVEVKYPGMGELVALVREVERTDSDDNS